MTHLTSSDYLTVYDQHGNTDSMPIEYPKEEPLNKTEIDRDGVLLNLQGILDAVSSYRDDRIGSFEATIAFLAEGGYHTVFSVKVKENKTLIARVSRAGLPDSSETWAYTKTMGEQALLQYVRSACSVPVPVVLCLSTISGISGGVSVKLPFLLMERVAGMELTTVYACLSLAQKVDLTKRIAKEMGDIFNITTSMSGSTVGTDEDGSLIIGPTVESARGTYPPLSAKPYSVDDLAVLFIEHLRKISTADASTALDALNSVRRRICSSDTPAVFHLSHPDLRMPNVFIESGHDGDIQVSAIIDWDLHTFLPAPLAADYPIWLRFDGFYNPKFNPRGRKFQTWWEEEHDTIQKLRIIFKEAVRETHVEFYDYLCNGTAQRELFYWFQNWDSDQSYNDAIIAWSKDLV